MARPTITVSEQIGASVLPTLEATYDAENLNNPLPPYPPRAFFEGVEGEVILRVLVLSDGLPVSVELHASSGGKRLDKAALETVA